MTISTETRRAGPYSGNGSTQVFAFSFKTFAAADLQVVTTTSGVDTVKTLTTHYTVSLNADQNASPGGSITMLTAPASATTLTIISDRAFAQSVNLQNAGGFLPDVINTGLDVLAVQTTQLLDQQDRSLRGALSDAVWDRLPPASARAGGLLGFDDSTGQPMIADFGTVEALAADINTVAAMAADIAIVADADVDIGTVADNITDVTTVADWIGTGGGVGAAEVTATGSTTERTLADRFAERYSALDFGVVADGSTETHVALQAAIDAIWEAGGGILEFPEGIMVLGATVNIWQNVILQGVGNGYNRLYFADGLGVAGFQVYGSVFKAKAGLNADLLVARYRLRTGQTFPSASADLVRHMGGMFDVTVFGNRSNTADPETRDTNTSGNGLLISGISGFAMDRVLFVRCADWGVYMNSYDYGAGFGATDCNNMVWGDVRALGNYSGGFRTVGGDNQFGTLTAGYNGGIGIQSESSQTNFAKILCWNNRGRGFYQINGTQVSIGTINSYDNEGAGIFTQSSSDIVINTFVLMRNGQDTGLSASLRAGIVLASGSTDIVIGTGVIADDGSYGGPFQQYGVSDTTGSATVTLGSIEMNGNVLGNFNGLTATNVQWHTNVGTTRHDHPGFRAQGAIDMNTNQLFNVAIFSGGIDGTATVATGVLTCSRMMAAYSTAADNTATDIVLTGSPEYGWLWLRNAAASNTLTLTHNTSKIRCPNGSDVVIGPYEAVILRAVNSTNTIWQVYAAAV